MAADAIASSAEEYFRRTGHADPESMAERLSASLEDDRMRGLARTPSLLAMLCELFAAAPSARMPTSRAGLFLSFVRHRCEGLPQGSEVLLEQVADESKDLQGALSGEGAGNAENVQHVLLPSGLFADEGDRLRFTDPDLHAFLQARYVLRGEPIAMWLWWRHLRPCSAWPERRLQVALLLAGLRLERGDALGPTLRLLVRRRRDRPAALGFLARLAADGASLPTEITDCAADTLDDLLVRPCPSGDWLRFADALHLLDERRLLTALEQAVLESSDHDDRAAGLLLERAPERAERVMRKQSADTSIPAGRRERIGRRLARSLPPDRAIEFMAERALDPTLDKAGHTFALTVLSHDRAKGLELLENQLTHGAWRDEIRLWAGTELLGSDEPRALPGLVSLGLSGNTRPYVRLATGRTLLDREDGVRILKRLAKDTIVQDATARIEAAELLPTATECDTCLAFIASKAGGLGETGRLTAALSLLERDRSLALAALNTLVDDGAVSTETRLRAASKAGPLDRGAGLERLGRRRELSTQEKLRAAEELARFNPAKGGSRLSELALTARGLSEGERLAAAVAATKADRGIGKKTFTELGRVLHDHAVLLEAIDHLRRFDSGLADKQLDRLADRWTGPDALDAANAIRSGSRRLACLTRLAQSGKLALPLRLEAIDAVARLRQGDATRLYRRLLDDGRLGHAEQLTVLTSFQRHAGSAARSYLDRLANDPGMPESLRKEARRLLR